MPSITSFAHNFVLNDYLLTIMFLKYAVLTSDAIQNLLPD